MLQARPGRSGKQQQEQISPNLGTAFYPSSVEFDSLDGSQNGIWIRTQTICVFDDII